MIRVSIAGCKSLIMAPVVLLVCVISLLASPAAAAPGGDQEVNLVPAVYVFGDSTVDVGNNQYLPGNAALQLPYGIDFPHSRPTGRFSNGYNVADFVAKLLGFKRSPPAYLSLTPRTSRQILKGLRGANYASGGSGILDTTDLKEQGFGGLLTLILCAQRLALGNSVVATGEGEERSRVASVLWCAVPCRAVPRPGPARPGEASERARACGSPSSSYRLHKWCTRSPPFKINGPSPLLHQAARGAPPGSPARATGGRTFLSTGNTITLTKQIEYFADTKSKMAASGGGQGSPSVDELLSKSLFLISDGGNDMFAFLQQNRSASEVPSFYADLLSNYTRHVRALHSLGARRFGIVDVPPLGCVPLVRVTSPDGAARCVDGANALARGFNDALRALLANLTASGALPGARYSVGSSYNVVSYFTAHPAAAGFREVASACCGGGRLNAQTGCTPNATYCSDRDEYLFWDGVHGTQATSRKGAVAIFSAPPQMGFAAPINFKQLVSS